MKTRTDMNMRKRKSKRNIILNSLIVVVFALILMIGGNMIFGSSATTDDQQNSDAGGGGSNSQEEDIKITEDNNADQKSETTTSNRQEGEDRAEEASREDENAIDRLEIHESEKEGNEDTQQDQEENESQQDDNDINSDMIGEPIGTSQTGEHTSSYEKGSVDWNEKVDAIQKVTGLDDSMTLWRLESGDGPQEAVGKVSPEGVQDWMYVVNLQWVDQKGWKVTSVDRQNR